MTAPEPGSGSFTGPPPPPPNREDSPTVIMQDQKRSSNGWDFGQWAQAISSGAKRVAPQLVTESLFIVAGAAILVAYALGWIAAILMGVRHQPSLSAQDRAMQFLNVGTVGWAAIVLLGTALVALGRRFEMGESDEPAELVLRGLLIAAALTVIAAVFGVLVELTNFGHGIDAALTGIVMHLAALPVAFVAMWWAWQQRALLRPPARRQ